MSDDDNVVAFPVRRTPTTTSDLAGQADAISVALTDAMRALDALRSEIARSTQFGDLDTTSTDPLAYATLLDDHLSDSRDHTHRAAVAIAAAVAVLTDPPPDGTSTG